MVAQPGPRRQRDCAHAGRADRPPPVRFVGRPRRRVARRLPQPA